ncbi:uncharacterized protein LOC105186277 [Harpegnathos saltator]|uniref:uncharacterized protein LOC105186277 n=1 Tax=Harpegnathos saltator TaxID=610380 RepID=UPI0005905C71|nr:uncharacterized protein LOC105186277 [Harpegnathos saltator]
MAQWKQEAILNLINAYRSRRFLWDHTTSEYNDRNKRFEAWKEIADEVGFDVLTVERKLKSLKTHFMSVHKAYAKRRLKADLNSDIAAKPKWFAYEAMTFLIKGLAPRVNREAANAKKQVSVPLPDWKPQEIPLGRDEFTIFAEHVAIRLKNITDVRARLVAQHQINNILFEAEIGKYNMHTYSTSMMENLAEPSTSHEEKMIIPEAV